MLGFLRGRVLLSVESQRFLLDPHAGVDHADGVGGGDLGGVFDRERVQPLLDDLRGRLHVLETDLGASACDSLGPLLLGALGSEFSLATLVLFQRLGARVPLVESGLLLNSGKSLAAYLGERQNDRDRSLPKWPDNVPARVFMVGI